MLHSIFCHLFVLGHLQLWLRQINLIYIISLNDFVGIWIICFKRRYKLCKKLALQFYVKSVYKALHYITIIFVAVFFCYHYWMCEVTGILNSRSERLREEAAEVNNYSFIERGQLVSLQSEVANTERQFRFLPGTIRIRSDPLIQTWRFTWK